MTSPPAARIARLLQGWESAPGQLATRLCIAIADLIDQGDLPDGDRLPSERNLAAALSISRGTVTEAYAHLREDGWISSRAGSGSFVTSKHRRALAGLAGDARLSTFGGRSQERIDLSSGGPRGLGLVVRLARTALESELFTELVAGDGYEIQGLPRLRKALGTYYAGLGVPTTADQVLVTSGSQQALKLLADSLVSPGDTIIVEDPSYRGALDVFRARGARLVPLPAEPDGPDVRMMERLVHRLRPRLVYLLPIAHNPTGYVVSPEKARRIAEIIDDSGVTLVEDGSPADLILSPARPPTPVGATLKSAQWIAIGSASKVFWGGLRIGWIRSDASMVHSLARAKAVEDLGSSLVSQVVTATCLENIATARSLRRAQLRESLRSAVNTLNVHAPEWSWVEPGGGSGLWVGLPGTDATAFAQVARRNGVIIVPGPVFSSVDGFQHHLRIPFWKEPDELTAGLVRLVEIWRAFESGRTPGPSPSRARRLTTDG